LSHLGALSLKDDPVLQRITTGVQEEMMVAMLDALQSAAAACALVCVKRMQDLHKQMLEVAKTTSDTMPPSDTISTDLVVGGNEVNNCCAASSASQEQGACGSEQRLEDAQEGAHALESDEPSEELLMFVGGMPSITKSVPNAGQQRGAVTFSLDEALDI